MTKAKKLVHTLRFWLVKGWVQWALAFVVFFLLSWLLMGSAINHCSTTTTALGSDSTGGFAWDQWAGGNDLSWGHTSKSYYPFGENLGHPQYITSTLFILIYKVFSSLSTPICGLNLIILLGYMSTALLMFSVIRWLLKRADIAMFAGFAAAFVPFHTLKSESHINYIYGSLFIAVIWAYLGFLSRPSYKRAATLAVVSSLGFYFDGYFVLFSAVLIGALYSSSFVFDALRAVLDRDQARAIARQALPRLKYLVASVVMLGVLLVPILQVYRTDGATIRQSLATVRSDIKAETLIYGIRPIEFVLPSYNNFFMPSSYANWRATKLHGSNFSESTLFLGYTVMALTLVGILGLIYERQRRIKLSGITYTHLVFLLVFALLACFVLSLPAKAYLFGHHIPTPVDLLVKVTANWRVLSRFILAIDPIVVVLASLGLYVLTKSRSKRFQITVVALCGLLLFMEYLPTPLHPTGDLYKDAPALYKRLRADPSAKIVAEYPLADFVYTPEVFTFQPVYSKTLLNANDAMLARGPFDSSLAGLNDPQTIGALERLKVDVVTSHGFQSDNPGLLSVYNLKQVRDTDGHINVAAMAYAYKIKPSVPARDSILTMQKGYESLSVDEHQISHRFITNEGIMRVVNLQSAAAGQYNISFDAASVCPVAAQINVTQAGKIIWAGQVGATPTTINATVGKQDFSVKTAYCSIDVTDMAAATD